MAEKMQTEKIYIFEKMPVYKAVMTLAVPTIVSSLVMMIYNLADTYFVGMLNSPVHNSAVTLAAPVLLAFNAVNNLFGVGSSSMMSRALGVKDYDTVKRSSAFGFYCSIICGVMFSLIYTAFSDTMLRILGADSQTSAVTADYLKWTVTWGAAPAILNVVISNMVRAEGSALHASIGTMSGCALNIILDPIFILPQGFGLGAEGAGLATFVSNCAACIYFFVFIFIKRRSTFVCVNPKMFRPKADIAKGVLVVGIPAAIQNVLNVTGMTVLNNFTASFGTDAVAAMGISQKISMIPMYVAMGISQGIMPLISYNYSSKNMKRAKGVVVFAQKASVGFLTATSVLFFIFATQVVGLFIDKAQIISYGASFLRGMCWTAPFMCVDFLAVGVFQACGMGMRSLVFAFMRKIVLEIPALVILDRLFPLYGLAYAQPAAEFILAAAAAAVLVRIFRNADDPAGETAVK